MKKVFNKKIIGFVVSLFEWAICITLVTLIALIAFQRFSNQGNFFGYRIYTIATGSMIPTYNIGDTVLIKEMPASQINVGDAVTYIGDAPGVDGLIITHRVEETNIDENGKYYFHTKGIANNIEDPIVYEYQVLGKVVHKFFFLSIIGVITTNMALLILFIIIPIAFIAGIELVKAVYEKSGDDDGEGIEVDLKTILSKRKNSHKSEEVKEENKNIDINKIVSGIYDRDEEEKKPFNKVVIPDKPVENTRTISEILEEKRLSREAKSVDKEEVINNVKAEDIDITDENKYVKDDIKKNVNKIANEELVDVNRSDKKEEIKSEPKKKKSYYRKRYYKVNNNNGKAYYVKKKRYGNNKNSNNKNKQNNNKSFQNSKKNDRI